MMPTSTRGLGMALGFPDVCNTPAPSGTVPVPYPNIAEHGSATRTVPNVLINMMDAFNMMTEIPMSSGDEAGVAHRSIKGPQRYTMGHPNVNFNMMPAITLACLTSHNQGNCPLGAVLVPSAPNVTINYRADESTCDPRVSAPETCLCEAKVDSERKQPAEPEKYLPALLATSGAESLDHVIAIEVFAMGAASEIADRVHRALQNGANTIAFDLRGSRGGVLTAAIDAAGLFLEKGVLIVSIEDEDGDTIEERSRGGLYCEVPLELWVDERTASAAEVFAGALFAHGRARVLGFGASIIGPSTFGKGTVVEIVATAGGTVLRPCGETILPNGQRIEGQGIVAE